MTELDAGLADALSLLATRIAAVPEVACAFIAGSAAAGFGNPTSDIDVFIGGSPLAAEIARGVIPAFLGTRRVDIEMIDEVRLALASDNLRRLAQEVPGASTSALYAAADDLKIVGAAVHSVPLPPPAPQIGSGLLSNEAVRRSYRRVLIARSNVWINNTAEDVYGLVQVGDDLPTRRRAHDLLELAIDTWLSSNGQDYPDEKYKWVTHRMRRAALADSDLRLLFHHYHPELSPASTPQTALNVAAIAQVLRARSLLKEFFSIDLAGVPLEQSPSGSEEKTVRCLPWLIIGIENKHVRATTSTGAWELPPAALVLLALSLGRDADAVVNIAARVLDHSRVYEMPTSDIRSLFDKLVDLQLIGAINDAPYG